MIVFKYIKFTGTCDSVIALFLNFGRDKRLFYLTCRGNYKHIFTNIDSKHVFFEYFLNIMINESFIILNAQ